MQQGLYQTALDVKAVSSERGADAPAGSVNIITAVCDDHQRLFSYYRQLQGPGLSRDEKEHLRHLIVHDLSVHSLAEEEVLYPAVKNTLGSEVRDHVLGEHTTLKKILMDIDGMDARDIGFEPRVEDLFKELRHHVDEEEQRVLPAFTAKVDLDELLRLGDSFEKVKGRVPTRPHTMAPDKPVTGNVLADRMTAPLDKVRDRVAGREVD